MVNDHGSDGFNLFDVLPLPLLGLRGVGTTRLEKVDNGNINRLQHTQTNCRQRSSFDEKMVKEEVG